MPDTPSPARSATSSDIEAVTTHHGLSDTDQIRFLTDADLFGTPRIGRERFKRLRASFPFDDSAENAEEERRLQEERDRQEAIEAVHRNHRIRSGYMHNVIGVQFVHPTLVFVCSDAPRYRAIEILWDIELPEEERQPGGCFGPEINTKDLKAVPAFPSFYGVTSIAIKPGNVFDDFRTLYLEIRSKFGIFTFDLYTANDGECLTGQSHEPDEGDYSSRALCWELSSEPKINKALQKVAQGFEIAGNALLVGEPLSALLAYRSTQKNVTTVLAAADKLAEVREVRIRPEIFGLTQSDTRELELSQDGIPAEEIFTRHIDLPSRNSPMSVARDIMRHLLDRGEDELARRAVPMLIEASPWMNDTQRAQLLHSLTILDELAIVRVGVSEAGLAGVTRKSIIEGVNARHQTGGGMARRAVLRWLDGDNSGFMKTSASKGVLYRSLPDGAPE